jgi:hypothetical protein
MTLALADALLHFHPFRVVEGESQGLHVPGLHAAGNKPGAI